MPYSYPQEFRFNWDLYGDNPYSKMKYSGKDVAMLNTSSVKICQLYCDTLYPLTGRTDIFSDIKYVEFTDTKTQELVLNQAIGLAYPDHNLNFVPPNLDRLMFAPYSGVISMELAHSLWYRLTGDWRESNDVIHWLFNESHLYTYDYVSDSNFRAFGGSLKLVIPDLKYGWLNRKAIMDGIRAGRYIGAPNPFWSVGQQVSPAKGIAAEEHELTHVINFLVTGDSRHVV